MLFLTAKSTDIGTRKKTNQDSMLIMQAQSDAGNILMASVCDGMGGLAKGEVASAAMVRALEGWFINHLPRLLANGLNTNRLFEEWSELIGNINITIGDYGQDIHVNLGTTCVILLIVGDNYYTANVGDSRIYRIADTLYQLTHDQSYVQREMDMGRMTFEQSLVDPNRSVLLQCIGASDYVVPDYSIGKTAPGEVFMLCCDGFRHVILPQEFYEAFRPDRMTSPAVMEKTINDLIRLNIARNEDDNISAIVIKTYDN